MINKVAIVTGSSKGIGKAIVLAFARSKQYSAIIVNARRIEEAQSVTYDIENSYSSWCTSTAIEADVSKESDCIRLIGETVSKYGRIDVLVNNAGVQEDIPFTETTLEEWYKIIGIDPRIQTASNKRYCIWISFGFYGIDNPNQSLRSKRNLEFDWNPITDT